MSQPVITECEEFHPNARAHYINADTKELLFIDLFVDLYKIPDYPKGLDALRRKPK